MVYNFNNSNVNNVAVFADNIVPPRSNFVNFSTRAVAKSAPLNALRESSDNVHSLNGEWGFLSFPNAAASLDTDSAKFNQIKVPSSWEELYPKGFPSVDRFNNLSKPPLVCANKRYPNVFGVYRKIFEVNNIDLKHILAFTKFYGGLSVYVNGDYCGYSDLSYSEFDISDYIILGENELIVTVSKYDNGSYFNATEKYACTGIVGDVLLKTSYKISVFDFSFAPKLHEGVFSAELDINMNDVGEGYSVRAVICDGEEEKYNEKADMVKNMSFNVQGEFAPYSEESPKLYDLYITVIDATGMVTECVRHPIGFRLIGLNGGSLFFNGRPIKLLGVNYGCEYDRFKTIITKDDFLTDLDLIKFTNFNTIKFTRPVDPQFINVCTAKGIYVIADFGLYTADAQVNSKKNKVTVLAEYASFVKAKAEYLFSSVKNEPCVVTFSFGAEDVQSPAVNDAYRFMSNAWSVPSLGVNSDITCAYNPSFEGLEKTISETDYSTSIFLSDYGYSLGISASAEEFYDMIMATPNCFGGCISEFVDNTDFVGGGVFSQNREPFASAENIKYVYRPYKAVLADEQTIEIANTRYFESNEKLKAYLNVIVDGRVRSKVELNATIPPQTSRKFDIFIGHVEGDMFLNVLYVNKDGKKIAEEQFPINRSNAVFEDAAGDKVNCYEKDNKLIVDFDSGSVEFSKIIGSIISFKIKGKEYLKADSIRRGANCFVANINRPFIRNIVADKQGFTRKLRDFDYVRLADHIDVNVETVLLLKGKEAYIIQDKYGVYPNGNIDVFSVLTPLRKNLPDLDCFGKQIRLANAFGNIVYYGRGSGDNYIDIYKHAPIGLYQANITTINGEGGVPQECGNRCEVEYAMITDNDGNGLLIKSLRDPLTLRFSQNSDMEISEAFKLKLKGIKQSGVYVDVNAFVSGVGSTENGKPIAKYSMKPAEYVVHFKVRPLYREKLDN